MNDTLERNIISNKLTKQLRKIVKMQNNMIAKLSKIYNSKLTIQI